MQNAFAVPNLTTSSASFTAADSARDIPAVATPYMDAGGVWNGLTEVSGVGDTFTLTIANTAAGLPADDTAFDLQDILVAVDPGFNLASSTLNINNVVGLPTCPTISVGVAEQPGGTGTQVRLNIGGNEDILPGCSYELSFGLTTSNAVTAGAHPVNYAISYDDNLGNPLNTPVAQNIDVNTGALNIAKTTVTTSATATDVITYNVTVTSTGTGGLFDVRLNDVLSADLNGLTFTVPNPPPGASGPGPNDYTFEYLAAGESVNLTVDATVTPVLACPVLQNSADLSERRGVAIDTVGPVTVQYDFGFTSGAASNVISHTTHSYCELCGDGVVSITIQNPTTAPLTNITIVEDLQASGLVYINNSTTVTAGSAANPGIVGNQLTWTSAQLSALANLAGSGTFVISFGVRSTVAENLITANRNITASADFDMSCLAATQSANTGLYELPLQEPVPQVTKLGRNVDGGQNSGNYTSIVYGQEFDDIIWRVDIQNSGLVGLQDLLIADTIGGNFVVNYICPTQNAAETTAIANNGSSPAAGCVAMSSPYAAGDLFGNPLVDVPAPGNAFVYYVGRINASCTAGQFNTADIEWGCQASPPAGGISATSTGINPLPSSAELSTDNGGGLAVVRDIRGIDGGAEIGSNGVVTITITNNSGGTVRDIVLDDLLPVEYVRDTTFTPLLNVVSLHSSYLGMIDTIIDTNQDLGNLLNNTQPVFTLTSSTARSEGASTNNNNMLRAGDIATITFRIVLVDSPHFDIVADLDVIEEDPASTPPNTDPDNAFNVSNTLTVNYRDTCTFVAATPLVFNDTFQADIEDLDVDTSALLYILTNDPAFPVPLTVVLTNNGGHNASNYYTYVSFGETMTVLDTVAFPVPAGCTSIGNPPTPRAVWDNPAAIPATAEVFECTDNNLGLGTINAGAPINLTFNVIKDTSPAAILADDLTFRADVIGVIELFDGTELSVPPPDTATINNDTNNYSLDAIRTRVLGFNLTKVLSGLCTEDANVPVSGDTNLIIGEDCTYRIEAGGWFGFATPGFTLIEVRDVVVTDDLNGPLNGQGYIQHSFTNDTGITVPVINGGVAQTPLQDNDITWAFNPSGSGITVKDLFFRVDITTRLLNDPVDNSAVPNLHAANTFDIGKASFVAVFDTATFNVDETAGVPGYPDESVRRVNLRVTEPNITVVKEVCNESIYTSGTTCSNFTTLANDGDTDDAYIYRITLTNEANSGGIQRAPAYNVISTDTLDSSDLMYIVPFGGDGLDNDGDGLIDGLDIDGEGSISENVPDGMNAPIITISNTHSVDLQRIDPGNSVTFYYRVDPEQTISPLQTLTNTVSMSYDSLDGDFGNQNVPQIPNGGTPTSGRARIYTTIDAQANVQMIPLETQKKTVIELSNTAMTVDPHNVSIGEEVRYEMIANLPVANLRQFKIRDELPPGIRCIEGQEVNLGAPPYSAAGFSNPGIFSATCTSTGVNDVVEWNFGDQELTTGTPGSRFPFPITFIARVDNSAANLEGEAITNGGTNVSPTPAPPDPSYCTGGVAVCYVNDAGNAVAIEFQSEHIVIREPVIALTKSFSAPTIDPVVNSDAADVLTVTVTATNTGTAAAYNLQVLDDLLDSDMTYIPGSVGITGNPPDNVDLVTLGANKPIFSWNIANPDYAIAPLAIKTFTFQVRVDTTAQPLELLDNTIEAKWDSLPDQNTALPHVTAPPGIGADGSVMGLRNGAVPNAANDPDVINDYETTATASTSVLPLTMTKTDLVPTVVPTTIGAHRNFEVVIDLPEGTTENLIINDNLLLAGGVSYVLSRNASFDVSYTFVDIVSIEGQPLPADVETVFRGATPADGDSGTIIWDIGQVITAEEDDYDGNANIVNPRIIINYFARPNNDLVTNVGVTLQNSATTTYNNGEDGTPATTLPVTTAVQTVLEPLLGISKTVTNITSGAAPVGGDVLEYVITINNTGNSTAFDSNIVDTLDDNLLFDASFTPTAFLNGVAVPLFNAVPTIMPAPASTLTWGRGNADNSLDIPVGPGQTLILTYRTVVQTTIQPNVVISNSALVDWTSLDDADPSNAFERTGAGCPVLIAPEDDYCSAPAVANITADNGNSIVKTVIADTYVLPVGEVRVGDIVTYQLDVNIQPGTTSSVNILDTVPVGLTLVDIISINGDTTADYDPPTLGPGSNFSYATIPAANVPAGGDIAPSFDWNLGTIINDGSTADMFVIIYSARVTKNTLPLPQSNSTLLTNTANLSYIDGNAIPSSPPGSSAIITVLQPIMDALSKIDRPPLSRPSGVTVTVATEVMNFRLETCNTTGLAPAYGLMITDTLANELDDTSLTIPVVTIGGSVVTEGVGNDYIYTPPAARGGTMVFTFNTPVDPTECVNIDFDIGFYTDFPANQSWSNTVDVNEYYSLPQPDVNAQLYPGIGPVPFVMNNNIGAFPPPLKTMFTPAPASPEASIGDEVTYRILVPETPANAIMYDVTITDTLDASLVYVGASDIGPNSFVLTDNTVLPGNVNLVIPVIPAGQQALIELRTRVDNNLNANAGVNFGNAATYRYANAPSDTQNFGGTDATASTLTIIEPVVAVTKSVMNTTKAGPPDAGDILLYTVTLTASADVAPAVFFADAFDLIIDDSLSLGLLFVANTATVNGNPLNDPAITGDGISTPQTLSWSPANADDIDVPEGTVVTITYDVLVLDSVLASQNLTNSVDIQWSSRDGPPADANERNGSDAPTVPSLNDYFSTTPATTTQTTPDNNSVTKSRLSDTFNPANNIVRIGDIVEYELRINIQEGTSPNFTVRDDLPQGLQFEQTVSVNGQTVAPYPAVAPFLHADIPVAVIAGDPTATTGSTVSWNVGDLINPGDNNIANDSFVIVYRARVLNEVYTQLPSTQQINNTVNVDYALASGAVSTKTDTELLDMQQPVLSITKVGVGVNGDTIIDAGEVVRYTVEITNNGASPAYDTELLDIIPVGLRSPTLTMVGMTLLSGTTLPAVLQPVYIPATGTVNWNFDTGVADAYNIPPGDTLQIIYEVTADIGLGAGLTLTNRAQVQFYYSFDNDAVPAVAGITGVREIYVPSDFAEADLTTALPNDLLKENPTDLNVSIGETFTYRITVPGTTQPTALYDVQILDDLTASAADLMFVGVANVSDSHIFTPVNIGTVTDNLIIADVTNGIDIPANEQVVIDVTVVLRNNALRNNAGVTFSNTATYTFKQVNGGSTSSVGSGNATPIMTIVEPELTLDKRGPVGNVNFTTPIPYTLVVENTRTGPAFDTTIIDRLPTAPDNNPPLTGGTCDTTPVNIVVAIFENDETTPARSAPPLALGTDYNVTYTAAPVCELVITTLSDKARIEATEKLIVTYDANLNVGTQSGAVLTNIAGATQWFSLDTAGAGATGETRTYTRTISNDGTPSVINHEDAFTVTVEAPVLDFQKTVFNVTTGQPGTDATPGDTLSYSITVQNIGPTALPNFSLTDEVDGLAPASGFFASNTMTNFVIPAGADNSNTDIAGGANGAGLLDVRNLSIDAAGGANDTLLIEFDVTLLPAIDSNTITLNQAQINSPSTGVLLSDDPNQPGTADPTPTLITSAPAFVVQKTSLDISGDPAILQPGDTLRYTLTVKNIGLENAINSLLSDQIPANTNYVANSTRLNTVVVPDPTAGISPLAAGMLINTPEDTTTGFLRADTNVAANNVATITFDVVVSPTAVNGTIISNQGFFNGAGAGSGAFPQQPSDDPGTALVDDPTIDVVGNVPVVHAVKTVAIIIDNGTPGIVDPGDTLRYTITTTNIGALPASNVMLTDAVPANTTYVANSTILNALAVPDVGAGVSPLIAGIAMSSSDLTPPVPMAGNGILSPANSAVVTFDVMVNALTAAGTIISNQGFVATNELPVEPTDADGNDANGNQTTDVVVGNVQQLAITKQVFVIGGGAAQAGNELEYVVRVTNIGGIAALNVVITDDMDLPVAGQKTYVAGSGLLDGLPAGVGFAGSLLTATVGSLPAAAVAELRFRVLLDAALTVGTSVSNTADVAWDTLPKILSANVSIDIGGTPGSVNVNGQVWHDSDFSNDAGTGETLLQDYRVELYRNNTLLANTLTGSNGVFQFTGLPPNLPVGDPYELRYFAPGATATTATLGTTSSAFTNGPQRITDILAASGTNVQNLNLPRQVNGIVYDSVLRVPVAGVQLTMVNQTRSNQPVPANCFNDPIHANQVTLAGGYYKFDLNFSDPARCAPGDEYEIQIQPPSGDYTGTTSVIIPPIEPVTGVAQDVPNCPGTAADKIPATAQHCENSASNLQPPATIPPRTPGTDYYLKFLLNGALFTGQTYNNHIPVDGILEAAVAISKVAGKLNVVRSDLVPYTITFNNTLGVPLFDISVIDNFPAGFKYVAGSARIDGIAIEPQVNGRQLTWPGLSVDINESRVIKLLLVVGSGVGEGEYVNTARAINTFTGEAVSGEATATVRVIPDPSFDCTDIIGKVFDDKNLNSYQDEGEGGVPGVQVATATGLRVTTDKHGRFHITCAVVANEVRGSNFIMKLDDRTLPSGYRVTTENPRVQRATRGKMLKFNFGTAIHRIVRLDLADGVFEKASTEIRPQWRSRIELLITELQKEGSILRLSYLAENESEDDVDDRLEAVEELISDRWQELDCCYKLTIETEVFWRKGSPSAGREFKE